MGISGRVGASLGAATGREGGAPGAGLAVGAAGSASVRRAPHVVQNVSEPGTDAPHAAHWTLPIPRSTCRLVAPHIPSCGLRGR
jgi:hypothetical protein